MSALPPKADIAGRQLDVRFVPQADILRCWSYSITSSAVASSFSTHPRGDTGARPAHPEYSAKPQKEGVSAVIAKSNVPPIANFIDGIFIVERSAMTAGLSVRNRRSKNSMQSGRQHSGGMQ
jgi:hypothetical protein